MFSCINSLSKKSIWFGVFFTFSRNRPIIMGNYKTYKMIYHQLNSTIENFDAPISVLSGAYPRGQSQLHCSIIYFRVNTAANRTHPLQVPSGDGIWCERNLSQILRTFVNHAYRTQIYIQSNPHMLTISVEYCHALAVNATSSSNAVSVDYWEPSVHTWNMNAIPRSINS